MIMDYSNTAISGGEIDLAFRRSDVTWPKRVENANAHAQMILFSFPALLLLCNVLFHDRTKHAAGHLTSFTKWRWRG